MKHLLIVEDEIGLQLGLKDYFEERGFRVTTAGRCADAEAICSHRLPDLVILDLGLPDGDGNDLLGRLKSRYTALPVIVLTARTREMDTLTSFNRGADDYVTKPFSLEILGARAEAVLRRGSPAADSDTVHLGDLTIDFAAYRVTRGGQEIRLSTRELEILKYLYSRRGAAVSRHDILDEVWGLDSDAGTRTVDTYVAWIRKKIEPNPQKPIYLLSQRGVGYMFHIS